MKEWLLLIILLGLAQQARPDDAVLLDRSRGQTSTHEKSDSRSLQRSESSTRTYTVDRLLFPLLEDMERSGLVPSLKKCQFAMSTARVWSHRQWQTSINLVYSGNYLQNYGSDPGPAPDQLLRMPGVQVEFLEPANAILPFRTTYSSEAGVAVLGKPWSHASAMECYTAYSVLAEQVVREMAAASVNKQTDQVTKRVTWYVEAPEARARQALARALESEEVARRINDAWQELRGSECVVPTAAGLLSGQTMVRCGAYDLDHQARTLRRAGVTLLSPDTVAGIRLQFSDAATESTAKTEGRTVSGFDRRERRQSGTVIRKDKN